MTLQFWHFVGLLLVTALMRTKRHAREAGSLPLIIFNLPSTTLHEMMHYAVALVTAGKPRGFTIFPERELYVKPDGTQFYLYTLGSVSFIPGVGNAFPAAMAPLGLIPFAFILYVKWFSWFPVNATTTLILYYIIFILISGSLPSKTDLKVAFSNPASVVVFFSVVALILGTLGILAQFVPTIKIVFYEFMVFLYS